MDINQLLSPDESKSSPRDGSSSASSSPSKQRTRVPASQRPTSTLSQEISRSPDYDYPQQSPSSAPSHDAAKGQYQSMPTISESSQTGAGPQATNPPQTLQRFASTQRRPSATHRPASTPQMDTLADLASMQQRHQLNRAHSSNTIRRSDPNDSQHGSPTRPSAPPVMRTHSGQSLADLTMAEAPAQTPPPRTFTSAALTDDEAKVVSDLLNYLSGNSYAYESHVQLINVLHKGLLNSDDPKSYSLVGELRQAREAMDSRFAVGEDIWLDWLADELLLAKTSEERIALTELFQKAVADEPASVKLWTAYADWVEACHASCYGLEGASQAGWTEDDKEMCRDLFTKELLADVLEQAANATQWRIDESHLLWNRLASLVQRDVEAAPSQAGVERLRNMFVQRLQTPHAATADTSQMFWPIVNKYEGSNWENVMAQVNQMSEPAKRQTAQREDHELAVQRALSSGDASAVFEEFGRYLKWEAKPRRQKSPFEHELRANLYERALLRFPTYTEWWLEYVDFVVVNNPSHSVIPLLERATRHCPWSGDLWALRILRADVEGKSREDIEAIKHRATNVGLLDVGGLEELLKMLQQWCSYLRRHAFRKESTEDDIDTAEVGITMAIEDIQQAGRRIYGQAFNGDPLFRLETVQTKFYTEARRLNEAREIYKRLATVRGDSSDFWYKYYFYEFTLWGIERMTEPKRIETRENGPHLATAVLQEALAQKNLDNPERILELYNYHFQQHESGERLQTALVEARHFSKRLAIRRAKEAEAAAESVARQPVAQQGEKRKAEEALPNGDGHKKAKTNGAETQEETGESSASASALMKRDREHNTLTLSNLPADVQQLDIEKFFREVGRPKSIEIAKNEASNTATATAKVEFESHDDVLTAKTRNGKDLNGFEVKIESGTQSTLFVSNYPPQFDEKAIRGLFDSYGEIVSVRFPSLKFNSRRRFCYVSFLNEEMAKAAEAAMDGKKLDGLHTLTAKISNPDAAKQRSGATAEGRELFIRNVDHAASEAEVREIFHQYGTVVNINLLKNANGRRTGSGFVVYNSSEEANAALEANNKPLKDRILHVEIAKPKGGSEAARKKEVIVGAAPSASPEPGANGRRGSDVSMHSSTAATETASGLTGRERKIAIFDLPDTVNDVRIKEAMEKYGPIVKIQLRREKGGAIVEFQDLQHAFNVRSGVDCSSLGEGVTTGDVGDFLKRPKVKRGNAAALAPPSVARPSQTRGGRRGGLGSKRAGLGFSRSTTTAQEGQGSKQESKSNADFRSMLEQSREKQGPTGEGAEK